MQEHASQQEIPSQKAKHQRGWQWRCGWILSCGCIASLALVTWLPRLQGERGNDASVTMVRDWVPFFLIRISFFSLFMLAALNCWSWLRPVQRRSHLGLALLICIAAYPVAFFYFFFNSMGVWELEDYTKGPDNRTYYFLHAGVGLGPGYTVALAQRTSGNPFYTTSKILCSSSEDDTTGTLIIRSRPIKPVTKDNQDRIYSTPSGWIAAVRGNDCVLAYNTDKRWTYSGERVLQLSPFVLIGARDHMYPADVRDFHESIVHWNTLEDSAVTPERAANAGEEDKRNKKFLYAALSHPNPEVRRATRDFVRAFKERKWPKNS